MNLDNTAHYADIFAALGSEPRLEIMRLLLASHPQGITVGDIQAQLQIPNSTLSHHLEKLRVEGLVNYRKDKQYLWYSANAETIEDLLSFLCNGCSILDTIRTPRIEAGEPVQSTSTEEVFMFERFLKSIKSLFGSIFDTVVLSKGFERLKAVQAIFLAERFTQKAIQAIVLAQDESRRLGHQYVGTEQILLGLMSEGTGIAAQVLTSAGVNLEQTQLEVEKRIGRGKGTPADIPFTSRAKQVLELSLEQARQLNHNYIGTEHLLLGILREEGGLAIKILKNLGIDLQNLEQQTRARLEPDTGN